MAGTLVRKHRQSGNWGRSEALKYTEAQVEIIINQHGEGEVHSVVGKEGLMQLKRCHVLTVTFI